MTAESAEKQSGGLKLLRRTDGTEPVTLGHSRRITLVGANGSGKSRFMKELAKQCGPRAYKLSVLHASFPEIKKNSMPGSIDAQYEHAVKAQPYMRNDAVSEIDKLAYMLLSEEFEALLTLKSEALRQEQQQTSFTHTRLDTVVKLWEQIFPGNRIMRHAGSLMFANSSGEDPAHTMSLSAGEKAVFYYMAAILYAMPNAVIFIDSPTLFIHPAIINKLWDTVEGLRPDCTFVYSTVDPDFVSSRTDNTCVWVRGFDVENHAWDYEVLGRREIPDELFSDIIGSRQPVLFIEGDNVHSIDFRLYSLVFPEFVVRPLGSCNKVIETTRSFEGLQRLHHLQSRGIVDRDRRTEKEVEYLRRKNIWVPDVAEIENIFLLESVIRIMARRRGRDPEKVVRKVMTAVLKMFASRYEQQALQHVRHQVKRDVECKVDARFTCITAMETHLRGLVDKLRPRARYLELHQRFQYYLAQGDYRSVLRVFNHKPMLPESGLAQLLGYRDKDTYIQGVLLALREGGKDADALRKAIRYCFDLDDELKQIPRNSKADNQETEQTGVHVAVSPKAAKKKAKAKEKKAKAKAKEKRAAVAKKKTSATATKRNHKKTQQKHL